MLAAVFSLSLGMVSWSTAPSDSGSYGDDRMQARDDVPVTQQTEPLLAAVDAGVVIVLSSVVRSYGPTPAVTVTGPKLCTRTGLVQRGEMAVPINSCSGMLITPSRVLTAAHCLKTMTDRSGPATTGASGLAAFSVLVGHHSPLFKRPDGSALVSGVIRPVKDVLYCAYGPDSDLAVLELDVAAPYGPIPTRYKPVLRRVSRPAVGEVANLVSSPAGLPVKLSSCAGLDYKCAPATVKRVGNSLFWATVDSHKGSSGGGAVDAKGDLFGIYSGGLPHESGSDCLGNVPYSDACPGDVLSSIDRLPADLFTGKPVPSARCVFGEDIDYPDQCHIKKRACGSG